MEEWVFKAADPGSTERLGRAIAVSVGPGHVIGLRGGLGAGKTTLVRSIAVGLGVDENLVSSPTFVLAKEYEGRLPVYHFDTYRLGDPEEFAAIGADEMLFGDGVCLIEWADRVEEMLPIDRLTIDITVTGEDSREFRCVSFGTGSSQLLARIAANCHD